MTGTACDPGAPGWAGIDVSKVTRKGFRMNASISHGFVIRGIIMAGLLLVAAHGAWAAAAFRVPAGERQLFLDDVDIAKIENLTRMMHQPNKKGAVIRASKPTETIQTRTAPVWDPNAKLFKTWVSGTDEPYRTSPDGLHWEAGAKPNLRVRWAVYDAGEANPARRFKAFFRNSDFMGVSPDGVTWAKVKVKPIQSSDESNFSFDEKAHLFIATVKRGGPYGRAVAIATSKDFRNWDDYGVVFHADALDQELGRKRIEARLKAPNLKQTEYNYPEHYSVQVYNMGVFAYEGIFIGLPSMYHHTGKVPKGWEGFKKLNLSPYIQDCVDKYGDYTGFYTVQMVSSLDLKNWKRQGDREPFIETSPLGGGAYDLQTIIGPSEPVDRGDELWFYYTGIKQYAFVSSGEIPGYDDYRPYAGAICLAVLRKDGFVSLDAGDKEGTLLTKPFMLKGEKLFANFAGHKHGELRAELVGADGKVLAGAKPLKGDHMKGQFEWKQGALSALQGKEVSLRFTLRDGSLYSYWIE